MNIKLYKTSSDKRVATKVTTEIATVTGVVLKENTSVVNPIIVLKDTVSNIIDCNYIYIGAFKRYYFVTDKISVKNGLWELHLHCDVLSTYWSQLKECDAIVKRQETDYNAYITDTATPVLPQRKVERIPFYGNAFNTTSYVLAVNG